MDGSRMLELVSPCGLYCGGCPLYRARTDKGLAERMAQGMGVSVDRVPVCLGCRAEEGCVAVVGEPVCATYNCAVNEKALDFCYQCEDFPCLRLAPCADRAQEIPHNSKIYNLLWLQKLGLEDWLRSADGLWGQYFKGKKPRPGDDVQI